VTDFLKLGAVLILLGFLAVGSVSLYLGTAPTPTTLEGSQEAVKVAKNWETVRGVGWILVGLGFAAALFGVVKSDLAIDTKLETTVSRLPRPLEKSTPGSNFVCSACGGDISEDAEVCPNCGERIVGE